MPTGALPQGQFDELLTDVELLEVVLQKADDLEADGRSDEAQRIYERATKTLAYIWRKHAPPGSPASVRNEVWRQLQPVAARLIDHGVTPSLGKMKEPFRPLPRIVKVRVRLTVGDRQANVMAILDTGASSSVIGLDVAEKLGLKTLMARSRSGIGVGGRITKFRTFVDRVEVFDWETRKKAMCALGPVHISVLRFGEGHPPMSMLLGNDLSAHLRMSILLTPKKPVIKCRSPKKLVEVFGLGHLLGLW